jgi:protoporphyrinogen oxidase
MNDKKVYIIGAGMAGLVAAYELESVGYLPVILEGSGSVGGRVKTDLKDGYLLDRGFHIFLTGYPEAQRYLDYDALNLKYLDPDMTILRTDGVLHVTDPLLNPAGIISMAFSKIGNTKDKMKLFTLITSLLKKSDEEIFAATPITTREYFYARGFSPEIIANLLAPLYRGIFLEHDLDTQASMFEYVFKWLHKGKAAIPEMGMQEIPNQLFAKLKNTEIRLNTKVSNIDGNTIHIENGEPLEADEIICTTLPTYLKGYDTKTEYKYHSVTNIYYALTHSFLVKPCIGLVPGENFLINNVIFPTDISRSFSTTGKALLSVSIVKDVGDVENLEERIAQELQDLSGIDAKYFEHIHTYKINNALPNLAVLRSDVSPSEIRLEDNIHLAGDYLMNGSMNAAMKSGRRAAESVILKHSFGESFQPDAQVISET